MSHLLAGLAEPVQPDREFREFLFAQLLGEIDFDQRGPAKPANAGRSGQSGSGRSRSRRRRPRRGA